MGHCNARISVENRSCVCSHSEHVDIAITVQCLAATLDAFSSLPPSLLPVAAPLYNRLLTATRSPFPERWSQASFFFYFCRTTAIPLFVLIAVALKNHILNLKNVTHCSLVGHVSVPKMEGAGYSWNCTELFRSRLPPYHLKCIKENIA